MDAAINGDDVLGFIAVVFTSIAVALCFTNLIMTYFIWSAYKAVPRQFQLLPTGLVWLCAVPCLGFIMLFICGILIPQSFQAAFAARRRTEFGDCGLTLALVGSIGMIGVVGGLIFPAIGFLTLLGCYVAFIVFIVKLHGYKRALLAG